MPYGKKKRLSDVLRTGPRPKPVSGPTRVGRTLPAGAKIPSDPGMRAQFEKRYGRRPRP